MVSLAAPGVATKWVQVFVKVIVRLNGPVVALQETKWENKKRI